MGGLEQLAHARDQGFAGREVADGDEDGVVSGDGAEGALELLGVQGAGNGAGSTGLALNDG